MQKYSVKYKPENTSKRSSTMIKQVSSQRYTDDSIPKTNVFPHINNGNKTKYMIISLDVTLMKTNTPSWKKSKRD